VKLKEAKTGYAQFQLLAAFDNLSGDGQVWVSTRVQKLLEVLQVLYLTLLFSAAGGIHHGV